ncbi:ITG-like peptide [Hetaerina americana]|uniref:ITG-like peptide n=1 Tax=Hetaerina americana TaxID=62018 RepID=UPI003A7F61A1
MAVMRRGVLTLGAALPLLLVALGSAVTPAAAWGGLFNRFSPEMLSNLGYGGHRFGGGGVSAAYGAGGHGGGNGAGATNGLSFGGGVFRSSPFNSQKVHPLDLFEEEVREAEEAENEDEDGASRGKMPDPCYGRKCTSNEHCCPGSVCVDVDGVVGSCLFSFGLRQGELCRRDGDCESGLLCAAEDEDETASGVVIGRVVSSTDGRSAPRQVADSAIIRTCQPPTRSRKLYGEECLLSSECDISKGLCCQLQRRHRQAPRKVCSYFKDSLTCIGPVAEERVKEAVRHTAGEKRITGKAGSFGRIRK